eukprot:scaffold191249_cov30-Tisochrysis_lutea.AAC.7
MVMTGGARVLFSLSTSALPSTKAACIASKTRAPARTHMPTKQISARSSSDWNTNTSARGESRPSCQATAAPPLAMATSNCS